MILPKGDPRREKYLKKGNILWRVRNGGGGANGLIATGIVLLVFAAVISALMTAADLAKGVLVFGLFFGAPGALLVLLGLILQGWKMKHYLDYYQKETGFDPEELKKLEQELMEPDMVMIGNVPDVKGSNLGFSEKNPQIACMITRHYFFMPTSRGVSYIRRLSDMVLAVYSEEIPGMGGCRAGLVFLAKEDDIARTDSLSTRDVCEEMIRELCERSPGLITERFVTDGDKTYDVITDSGEIAKLIKKRRETAKEILNTVEYFEKK